MAAASSMGTIALIWSIRQVCNSGLRDRPIVPRGSRKLWSCQADSRSSALVSAGMSRSACGTSASNGWAMQFPWQV